MVFWRRSGPKTKPVNPPDSIGAVLLKMRAVTPAQLAQALERKAPHDDLLLGSVLRELGICSSEQVARALLIQAKLRSGDEASAALELMTARLSAFGDGEAHLLDEIEKAKRSRRDQGDAQPRRWLVPLKV